MQAHVLIVEDDHNLREALSDTLALKKIAYLAVESGEKALELMERQPVAMVISDVNMPGMSGHDLLGAIKNRYPWIPVALITAYGQVDKAVEAIRQGAVDYLLKPFEPLELIELIHTYAGLGAENKVVIAESAQSLQLLQIAKKVAMTDSTVLITGESGTGKEVLARYIHQQSPRSNRPFVAINCAAIPESMLEATLFGYEKGAFTGALQAMPGKFEQANGGTLLLDEVSEMDVSLQAKLLRVLQEQEVERLGGRKEIKLDVRVLATTNRDLSEAVKQHAFREDLFFRLNVFPLRWLPLRDRPEDILPIAQHLLHKHLQKMHRGPVQFTQAAQMQLCAHNWPGNIRELDNTVQRALILQNGAYIEASDLMIDGFIQSLGGAAGSNLDADPGQNSASHLAQASTINAQDNSSASASASAFGESPDRHAEDSLAPAGLDQGMRHVENQLIIDVLLACKGSRKKAAEQLEISPRTLRYKLARMREDGLDVDRILSEHSH